MRNDVTRCCVSAVCLAILSLPLVSCGGDGAVATPTPTPTSSGTQLTLQTANFVEAGLVGTFATVDCTLSGGTTTTCHQFTTTGAPPDHAVGTFCPRNIADDGAGSWFEGGVFYDLTGAFIRDLATFYNDSGWQMYDTATGDINVTDTQAEFEGAARPDVDPSLQNHCVEGKMSYVGGGIERTYLIPTTPVPLAGTATDPIGRDGVGVALNGIRMDAPAPVDAIKAAYTIAAFDDCGGHINPFEGYHYHASTGCPSIVASTDGHAALIGYALDGYGIYAETDANGAEATGLDTCRGHTDATRGYHYHVASAGENMFIGCFHGEQGSGT